MNAVAGIYPGTGEGVPKTTKDYIDFCIFRTLVQNT